MSSQRADVRYDPKKGRTLKSLGDVGAQHLAIKVQVSSRGLIK